MALTFGLFKLWLGLLALVLFGRLGQRLVVDDEQWRREKQAVLVISRAAADRVGGVGARQRNRGGQGRGVGRVGRVTVYVVSGAFIANGRRRRKLVPQVSHCRKRTWILETWLFVGGCVRVKLVRFIFLKLIRIPVRTYDGFVKQLFNATFRLNWLIILLCFNHFFSGWCLSCFT